MDRFVMTYFRRDKRMLMDLMDRMRLKALMILIHLIALMILTALLHLPHEPHGTHSPHIPHKPHRDHRKKVTNNNIHIDIIVAIIILDKRPSHIRDIVTMINKRSCKPRSAHARGLCQQL